MDKNILKIAVIVFIVGFIGGYIGGLVGNNQPEQSELSVGSGTRLQNGISADNIKPSAGEVRGTTLTITSTASFTGALTAGGIVTLNAGQLRSYTNATTSVTTGTLRLSDVQGYDTILLTPTGAAANKTLTFFASSTASTWLPTAGDMQETCFLNGTTTAATTITFAAGTGIDLEVASSTSIGGVGTLILPADSVGCFKFIRKTATLSTFDISAEFVRYVDAD